MKQKPCRSTYRLAAITSHPVQYQAPLFQKLALHPLIDLTVYYGDDSSLSSRLDVGFGIPITWDRPLLAGYRSFILSQWSHNYESRIQLMRLARIIFALVIQRYDAVFIHSYATPLSILAYIGAWLSNTPILLRTESEMLRSRSSYVQIIKKLLLQTLFRATTGFLTIGTANRVFYEHYGVHKDKMFHTPYSVDNDFFLEQANDIQHQRDTLRQSLGFDDDIPIIIFSGKFIERKRPLDLLQAYRNITSEGICAGLLYIGDGELRNELERFIAEHQLSNVRITGFKNQTELPSLYICGDIFVLPARFETWGLVVNEAMLFSMPVIVTDMVGCRFDLVEPGVTGYIYPVGDIAQLTTHLRTLLLDPTKRFQMGNAAQKRIAQWSLDECVDGILAALTQCVPQHRKSGENDSSFG